MRPVLYAIVLSCAFPLVTLAAERQYRFAVTVTTVTPAGKKVTIAEPVLVTLEGQTASFLSGETQLVPDHTKQGALHEVAYGFSLKLTGRRTKGGACRLDLVAEHNSAPDANGISREKTLRLHLAKTVQPNEVVKRTLGAYTIQLRVTEVDPLDGR
jgi:hypothetical protein